MVVCRFADSDELIARVVISTCSIKCNDDFLRGRSFEVMVQVNELHYGGEEKLEIPLVDNVGIINHTKITKLVSGKDALVWIGSFLGVEHCEERREEPSYQSRVSAIFSYSGR